MAVYLGMPALRHAGACLHCATLEIYLLVGERVRSYDSGDLPSSEECFRDDTDRVALVRQVRAATPDGLRGGRGGVGRS